MFVGGSNEEPESASEEDRIPGLHTDTEASDAENVVLVCSKEVGTLPRGSKVSYKEYNKLYLYIILSYIYIIYINYICYIV